MSISHRRDSGRATTKFFNRAFPHIVRQVGPAAALLLDQLYRAAAAGVADWTLPDLESATGLSTQVVRTARKQLRDEYKLISWRRGRRSSRYSLDFDRIARLYAGANQTAGSNNHKPKETVSSNSQTVSSNSLKPSIPINRIQSNQRSIETAKAGEDPARGSRQIPDSELARAVPWIETNKPDVQKPVAYAQRCWNNREVSGLPWNDPTAGMTDEEYYSQGKPESPAPAPPPSWRDNLPDGWLVTDFGVYRPDGETISIEEAKRMFDQATAEDQQPITWRWIAAQQRRAWIADFYMQGINAGYDVSAEGYRQQCSWWRKAGIYPAREEVAA